MLRILIENSHSWRLTKPLRFWGLFSEAMGESELPSQRRAAIDTLEDSDEA